MVFDQPRQLAWLRAVTFSTRETARHKGSPRGDCCSSCRQRTPLPERRRALTPSGQEATCSAASGCLILNEGMGMAYDVVGAGAAVLALLAWKLRVLSLFVLSVLLSALCVQDVAGVALSVQGAWYYVLGWLGTALWGLLVFVCCRVFKREWGDEPGVSKARALMALCGGGTSGTPRHSPSA